MSRLYINDLSLFATRDTTAALLERVVACRKGGSPLPLALELVIIAFVIWQPKTPSDVLYVWPRLEGVGFA